MRFRLVCSQGYCSPGKFWLSFVPSPKVSRSLRPLFHVPIACGGSRVSGAGSGPFGAACGAGRGRFGGNTAVRGRPLSLDSAGPLALEWPVPCVPPCCDWCRLTSSCQLSLPCPTVPAPAGVTTPALQAPFPPEILSRPCSPHPIPHSLSHPQSFSPAHNSSRSSQAISWSLSLNSNLAITNSALRLLSQSYNDCTTGFNDSDSDIFFK